MRLDELTGIKHLQRTTRDSMGLGELMTKVRNAGYTVLGIGGFGFVAQHANGYVLKVFKTNDLGYKEFFEYCKRHPENQHLPKFISPEIRNFNQQYAFVRLEKLTDINIEQEPYKSLERILIDLFDAPTTSIEDFFAYFEKEIQSPEDKALLSDNYNFFRTIFDLKRLADNTRKIDFDLIGIEYNIMLRGDTPVITDPFAV